MFLKELSWLQVDDEGTDSVHDLLAVHARAPGTPGRHAVITSSTPRILTMLACSAGSDVNFSLMKHILWTRNYIWNREPARGRAGFQKFLRYHIKRCLSLCKGPPGCNLAAPGTSNPIFADLYIMLDRSQDCLLNQCYLLQHDNCVHFLRDSTQSSSNLGIHCTQQWTMVH